MAFVEKTLGEKRPDEIRTVALPRREAYHPSPEDWRDEVFYFLLPDRFSNGQEKPENLLNPSQAAQARNLGFRFDKWAQSGGERWQGGTLKGIASKLDYLQGLGVSVIWVGPVFKQRTHLDTYHGYGIQDFLEVDPHLGTRKDLVSLVKKAHAKKIRVVLDIVFNHSGCNWLYGNGSEQPRYLPWPAFYGEPLQWRNAAGGIIPNGIGVFGPDEAVWPAELRPAHAYTRAGTGSLAGEEIDNDYAEMRRTDFLSLRDFNFDGSEALHDLVRCYKYWIALTDCDGFRLDTLKHLPLHVARNFCGGIKEYAANLGKRNFFLVGEVAGNDAGPLRYLQVLGHNLNATLDIGSLRGKLHAVAKGLEPAENYFSLLRMWDDALGSHRDSGGLHMSILDDHDHVSGSKTRFSTDAASPHQVVAGVAIQLFSLGIPCVYYGTEQAFAGPEKSERIQYLPDFGSHDKFLREAMFGPLHPNKSGAPGLADDVSGQDPDFPGFGPFGTTGKHCFDSGSPTYRRIAHLAKVRREFPVLRQGRQYQRPLSHDGGSFTLPFAGDLIAWSRILDEDEALIVVNSHGLNPNGGDIAVDAILNGSNAAFLQIIANTLETITVNYAGPHPIGSKLPVLRRNGTAYVEIRGLGPSEVLVLLNHP